MPSDARTILPGPFAWIDIPAGKVTIEDASHHPKPGTAGGEYEVAPYAIAQYPVTNAQWQAFVQADNGYRDVRWWDYSEAAQLWHADFLVPKATAFTGDDLPRTNVCWFDALAFCRWLSHETGEYITLPTEQQWQRAAQGDDGRVYPWGNRFDRTLCTSSVEESAAGPTPVMLHPDAASPFGVHELVGNVWEWCLSIWGKESCNPDGNCPRVLMGSAWTMQFSYDMRVANRYRFYPAHESNDIGFRIVRDPERHAAAHFVAKKSDAGQTASGGLRGLFGRRRSKGRSKTPENA